MIKINDEWSLNISRQRDKNIIILKLVIMNKYNAFHYYTTYHHHKIEEFKKFKYRLISAKHLIEEVYYQFLRNQPLYFLHKMPGQEICEYLTSNKELLAKELL